MNSHSNSRPMKRVRPALLSLTAFLSATAPLTASAQSAAPIKVGVLLPSSGVYAQLGEEGFKGFSLYLDSVGDKVAGHPITLVREDEGADPAVALSKANKLISSDRVDLLAGVVLTPSAYALAPVVEAAKVPLVVFNAAGNALTRDRKNPYVFRVSGNAWQYSNPFGRYVASKISKNTFLVGADYAFGKESVADFKASYTAGGGKVAGEVYTPLGSTDFSPYLARIAAAKPTAVYAVLSGSDAVLFMKQFAQFGLNKTIKLAVFGDMTDEKFIDAVGDSAVGYISALPWAYDLNNDANKTFIAAYRAKYKNELPGVFAQRGWDTARVIVEALKRTKGDVADKPALLNAIRSVSFPSPRGVFSFDPVTQNVINPMYVREVVKTPDGLINKQIATLGTYKDPGK